MADIVMLVSSLHEVAKAGLPFVFTNQHAYPAAAQYYSDLQDLNAIDWKIIIARNFSRDVNDPGKIERYMAEALVHRHVPVSTLLGIACYGPDPEKRVRGMIDIAGVSLKTAVRSDWYF